ncbi:MAG TPA: hypothetical protein VFS34_17835 [Thermoanaerobaculia bacterium]|nr:hypothetical protein [Thermoanaerobaculia bacterium]
MRIEAARESRDGERASVTARFEWEDADLPPLEMFFSVAGVGAEALRADLHPFLLAAAIPAWRRGERRIAVAGSLCPRLRDGIGAAQRLLSRWWRLDREAVRLEPASGWRPFARRRDRAALFLTGGVDSLHLLRTNRRAFPADHPAAFRDAISSLRMSFVEAEPSPRAVDLARRQSRSVAAVAAGSGLDLVEIDSNFRLLDPAPRLAGPQEQGALLAALAHLAAARVGSAAIAATFHASSLPRWGTHPLLDPLYSSSGVEIRHEGYHATRPEKIEAIADWDLARRHLLVCFEGPLADGELNCGRCEKCLRTMTALEALGVLDEFPAFGGARVTEEAIEAMTFGYSPEYFEFSWAPLLALLESRDRRRLARAVRAKIARGRRIEAWNREADWRGRLRRLDRRFLGGALVRVTRKWRGLPATR